MFCINCFHKNTRVGNSRPHKKQPSIWRRRTCPQCGATFTTYERPSLADNTPIQLADGQTDTFNLGRLIISIAACFTHNPSAGTYQALWLAQTVEATLSTEHTTSLTPEDIEATTHQVLRRYDEMAAIQYAAKHNLIYATRKPGRPSVRAHAPRSDASPSR